MKKIGLALLIAFASLGSMNSGVASVPSCSPEQPCKVRLRASHQMKRWTTPESFDARAHVVIDMFVRGEILTFEPAPDCGAHYTGLGVSAYGQADCARTAPIRFSYVSFRKPTWLRVVYYSDGLVP